jgi:hypothetical protein
LQKLISAIIKNTNDEEKLFRLLKRMKDKKLVFKETKIYMYEWKPETTMTLLALIKDEHGIDPIEIKNIIKKLKVFSSIIE